jgi:hypothetical protein
MTTILFNTITNQLVSNDTYPDGYKHFKPTHIIELEVVNTPAPTYDTNTHKAIMIPYSRVGDTWVNGWDVIELSEQELAERDWGQPDWPVRLRVIADKGLKLQMGNVLSYWDDEGMPRDEKNGFIRLWCREVLPAHNAFITAVNDQLAAFGEQVYIEDRPVILNPEL